ncbi:hypothetical protein ENUP19_0047G0035 [Entamoeba nuttalli]|uniref:Protein kinase domain containing protein n=2 Tax=Entamoeba nuttalli TaxID=412467 RepID=K2H7M0_ENTNP|nr:protein kinase domain containing protein [Entamoeba nuttalli P19]EKE38524.1 protein kinase domain containing protein [Entamoeba nuttalli P19]|eukprot:XP_008859130.1 protein kinase domain containing protein [Entamoeba nuttalli P19]
MKSISSVGRNLIISTEDRYTQYFLPKKLFDTDSDYEITKLLLQILSTIDNPLFEKIQEWEIGFDENGDEIISIVCEIDRLVNDYFNSAISIEAIQYFSSDIQTLIEIIISLKQLLCQSLKSEQPFLFSSMSFALQSDPSSPIPQMKVSSLGFLLPHFINSVKELDGIKPFVPNEFLVKNISSWDITTKVEINSFGVLLNKLLFQQNPVIQDSQFIVSTNTLTPQLNGCLIQPPIKFLEKLFKRRLISFSKIKEAMMKDPYFNECWKYKHIEPEYISNIFDIFDRESCKILGKGSFGCVFSASCKGNFFAIKEMSDYESAIKEVRTMNICSHENVVKLYKFFKSPISVKFNFFSQDAIDSNTFYYIIMECSAYGSLFNFISMNPNGISLQYIQQFMFDINNAMKYLIFTRQIIHRDIKTQNILVFQDSSKPNGLTLKLCDFGSSRLIGDNNFDTIFVGSSYTNQPEISHGTIYNEKCDLFSIGVILYEMITGTVLNIQKTSNIPIENYYSFYQLKLNEIIEHSNEFVCGSQPQFVILIDLLRKLFVTQDSRLTWKQYLQHPFFSIIIQ